MYCTRDKISFHIFVDLLSYLEIFRKQNEQHLKRNIIEVTNKRNDYILIHMLLTTSGFWKLEIIFVDDFNLIILSKSCK